MNSGLGSLINGVSLKGKQNSPIFWMSPPFPVYKVRQPFQSEAYPLVSLQMSPCWIHVPGSSQTETLIDPDRSATLHVRTSWPSLVMFGRPISKTMNIILRFFIPGFKSRIVVGSITSGASWCLLKNIVTRITTVALTAYAYGVWPHGYKCIGFISPQLRNVCSYVELLSVQRKEKELVAK